MYRTYLEARNRMSSTAAALVAAALALAGCAEEPPHYLDGGPGPGTSSDMAVSSSDMPALMGLPCDVSSLLQNYCQSCHGQPPRGAPIPLVSYQDLVAASAIMPSQKVADRALNRMQDSTNPMPPGPAPTVPQSQIAAFQAWVNGGLQPGDCQSGKMDMGSGAVDMRGGMADMRSGGDMRGSGDMSSGGDMRGGVDMGGGMVDMRSDPLDSPPVCTSGKNWTRGNTGSPQMHPGGACITCHSAMRGPSFRIAGTVYPTGHEPNDCLGAASTGDITVEITDNTGKVFSLTPNASGNFYYPATMGTIALPYHAKVKQGTRERAMSSSQMSGDCNSCHTQTGASGAPGRITLPY